MLANNSIVDSFKSPDGAFDFVRAWQQWSLPQCEALPADVVGLFERVGQAANEIVQDKDCDLPWPYGVAGEALRSQFAAIPEDVLRHAAEVLWTFGHWKSGAVPPSVAPSVKKALGTMSRFPGAYWQFQRYADQYLRESAGLPWKGKEPRPKTPLEQLCQDKHITLEILSDDGTLRYTHGGRDIEFDDEQCEILRAACHRLIGLYGTGMHAARALGLVQGTFAGFVSRAENRCSRQFAERVAKGLDTTVEELLASDKTIPSANVDGSSRWKATVRFGTRKLTVPFTTGSPKPPSVADVVSSLILDTQAYESAPDFKAFCADLGLSTDSRSAEQSFKQCRLLAPRVRLLLGNDFDAFCLVEH
jgi:hypothetical protein